MALKTYEVNPLSLVDPSPLERTPPPSPPSQTTRDALVKTLEVKKFEVNPLLLLNPQQRREIVVSEAVKVDSSTDEVELAHTNRYDDPQSTEEVELAHTYRYDDPQSTEDMMGTLEDMQIIPLQPIERLQDMQIIPRYAGRAQDTDACLGGAVAQPASPRSQRLSGVLVV